MAARADGNPFFMEELVRQLALRRTDAGHDEGVELPATIQGVISARIDLLRPRERRVLQAASIMGRIFWPTAVAHLTGLETAEVDMALRRLEALQMVRRNLRSSLEGETEYLFQHNLISETAYGRLARTDLKLIFSEVHQMFGRYSGRAIAADGEHIEINGLIGFAEEHRARW